VIGSVASGVGTLLGGRQARKGLEGASAELAQAVDRASIRLAKAALDSADLHGQHVARGILEFADKLDNTATKISDEWLRMVEEQIDALKKGMAVVAQRVQIAWAMLLSAILLQPLVGTELRGETRVAGTLLSFSMERWDFVLVSLAVSTFVWWVASNLVYMSDRQALLETIQEAMMRQQASQQPASPQVTWTTINANDRPSSKRVGAVSIPRSVVPDEAKEILVWLSVKACGIKDYCPGKESFLCAWTQDGQKRYEFKLAVQLYFQNAYNNNDSTMWLPLTSSREMHLEESTRDSHTSHSFHATVLAWR